MHFAMLVGGEQQTEEVFYKVDPWSSGEDVAARTGQVSTTTARVVVTEAVSGRIVEQHAGEISVLHRREQLISPDKQPC